MNTMVYRSNQEVQYLHVLASLASIHEVCTCLLSLLSLPWAGAGRHRPLIQLLGIMSYYMYMASYIICHVMSGFGYTCT